MWVGQGNLETLFIETWEKRTPPLKYVRVRSQQKPVLLTQALSAGLTAYQVSDCVTRGRFHRWCESLLEYNHYVVIVEEVLSF